VDPEKPLSSDDLIKQARQDLEAVKDDMLPSSKEMTRAANETPTPTEIEQSLAADLAALGQIESELDEVTTPPEVDFAPPEPAPPRRVSRGDHTPANVDGPVQATAPPRSDTPTWRRFLWLIPVVVVGVSFLGSIFENTGTDDPVVEATAPAIFAGDCFDNPGGVIAPADTRDCSEPHDFEVFAIFDQDDAPDATQGDQCLGPFEEYVGTAYFESELWLTWLPLEDSPSGFACLVYESPDAGQSASQVTGTLRNSNR